MHGAEHGGCERSRRLTKAWRCCSGGWRRVSKAANGTKEAGTHSRDVSKDCQADLEGTKSRDGQCSPRETLRLAGTPTLMSVSQLQPVRKKAL